MNAFIQQLKENMNLKDINPRTYSPLALAYIGDVVFDLVIRTLVIYNGNAPVHKLHLRTSGYVKASSQANMVKGLEDELTDEEAAVFKRGRNAKSATVPKNADWMAYKLATGFEALIGYLYLDGQYNRMLELISKGVHNDKTNQ